MYAQVVGNQDIMIMKPERLIVPHGGEIVTIVGLETIFQVYAKEGAIKLWKMIKKTRLWV